jgi:glycosyltransferase involved in cell wall biosynthesis
MVGSMSEDEQNVSVRVVSRPEAGEPAPAADVVAVSVVLPCRGPVAHLLAQQLAALAGQDFSRPWEAVIVDNGMDEECHALVRQFRGQLPALHLIDARAHASRGYALNRGIEQARSDRIVTLDCDDVVATDYLRHMASALAEHDIVGARVDSTSLNEPWLRRRRTPIQEDRLDPLLAGRPMVIGAAMGFRRPGGRPTGG